MPYKIRIEAETTITKFKNLLEPKELPRGLGVLCKIYVTNIGNEIIPKCVTSRLAFDGSGFTTSFENLNIPDLKPDKRTFIKQIKFVPYDIGIGWIVIAIAPVNNENFSYYHVGSETARTEDWRHLFYVVDREMLEILSLLKTPTTLTKRKKKKKK